ncbi:MAG: hypothetical protein KF774_04345 [Planctomyces sp.]|nr:hypothetical protein [Planctomyces sp.]
MTSLSPLSPPLTTTPQPVSRPAVEAPAAQHVPFAAFAFAGCDPQREARFRAEVDAAFPATRWTAFNYGARGVQGKERAEGATVGWSEGTLTAATDLVGSAPMHVWSEGGAFIASTHLRPLARAVHAAADPVGISQLLRHNFTLAGRTVFSGIRRLLGGQRFVHDGQSTRCEETSRLWANPERAVPAGQSALDRIWEALQAALNSHVDAAPLGLMMSAGWDSRTLLAAAEVPLTAYTHGDLASRELRITRELCSSRNVPLHESAISEDWFTPTFIQRDFAVTETATFPYWSAAGEHFAQLGVRGVLSGDFGEILGGHYLAANQQQGGRKALGVLFGLLGIHRESTSGSATLQTRLQSSKAMAFAPGLSDRDRLGEATAADVDWEFRRLQARGVEGDDAFVEAFTTEHRGAQWISGQPRSAAARVEPVQPFLDVELLQLVTRIAPSKRTYNRLNRLLLQRHAPQLLRFATGATVFACNAPMLLQEASRMFVYASERFSWTRHTRTGGVEAYRHYRWDDFEFLRDGRQLLNLVDDLKSPIWNVSALRRYLIGRFRKHSGHRRAYSVANEVLRIYGIDQLLRP